MLHSISSISFTYVIKTNNSSQIVHSRFDIDPSAIIDDYGRNLDPGLREVPASRRVRFLMDFAGNSTQNLVPRAYIEVYGAGMGNNNRDNYNSEDGSDEELMRALELSRKEF